MAEIVNKVAKSGLILIDLSEFKPHGPRFTIDLKDFLWQGIALREKEFRTAIKETEWANYSKAYVNVHCSVEAIVPAWAYMLISAELQGVAKSIYFGSAHGMEESLILQSIDTMDASAYQDALVLVKGCGEEIPTSAYLRIVQKLKPIVRSLMYGEACSAVPVYKRARKKV